MHVYTTAMPGSRVIFGRAESQGETNVAFGQRGGVGLGSYGVAIGYGEGGLRPEELVEFDPPYGWFVKGSAGASPSRLWCELRNR
jgi:hypothetical protein